MNQSTNYLVVGQGIGGTMVSYFLHRAGQDFVVIDPAEPVIASRVAGGVINPVTGKKVVKTWLIDELRPFAERTYHELGQLLGEEFIAPMRIHRYHSNPEDVAKYHEQAESQPWWPDYIAPLQVDEPAINNTLGAFTIKQALQVRNQALLDGWRDYLKAQNRFLQERFDYSLLQFAPDGVAYKGIHAKHVIFCEGWGAKQNPWFGQLPFNAAKGEALRVRIRGLLPGEVYLKGVFLVPLGEDIYYVGSTNEWVFDDELPSAHKRDELERKLQKALNLPYEILEHHAAVRPTVKDRRPLIGQHPAHPQLWAFNGLGTKGYSLSPYFAHQLVQNLLGNGKLDAEVDLSGR